MFYYHGRMENTEQNCEDFHRELQRFEEYEEEQAELQKIETIHLKKQMEKEKIGEEY